MNSIVINQYVVLMLLHPRTVHNEFNLFCVVFVIKIRITLGKV